MRLLFFYVWRTIKETGIAILLLAVIPFLTLAVAVGFRACWQCQKIRHLSTMRKYWTWHDTKKPVDVCANCFEILRESDEEGFI